LDWSTRITTIGLEFALPVFFGFGADRWLGTSPWLTVLGAFLGLAVGMLHVMKLAAAPPEFPGARATGRNRSESHPQSDDSKER